MPADIDAFPGLRPETCLTRTWLPGLKDPIPPCASVEQGFGGECCPAVLTRLSALERRGERDLGVEHS